MPCCQHHFIKKLNKGVSFIRSFRLALHSLVQAGLSAISFSLPALPPPERKDVASIPHAETRFFRKHLTKMKFPNSKNIIKALKYG